MNLLRRIPWGLVGGLVLGIVVGLVYAWMISPVQYVDAAPQALRSDFKEQYRLLISRSYQADGDLGRAQVRLAGLGDDDPAAALLDQASRLLAEGDPEGSTYALLLLAQALQPTPAATSAPSETATLPAESSPATNPSSSSTPQISGTPSPGAEPAGTEPTPFKTPDPTASLFFTSTPRPTRTPIPTQGAPFVAGSVETICDPNQLGMQLQVVVLNARREPMPGIGILVTWQGGSEWIFTGLKPELGNGYADLTMLPAVDYSVQAAAGGDKVGDLTAPECESGGNSWWGSLRLTFQQP